MSCQKNQFKRFSTEQITDHLNAQSTDGLVRNISPTQLKQILTMMTSFHPRLSDEP
ncbi:hypothetical protein [Photorhabdus laumondii]